MNNQKKENRLKTSTYSFFRKMISDLTAIILCSLLCWLVVTVMGFIYAKAVTLFSWIADVSSKIDAVIIVALITGMVSIVGFILNSIVSKSIEYKRMRREYLTQKREEPYSDFIEMIYRTLQSSNDREEYRGDDMEKDLIEFSKQITLWGSPQVVKQWGTFRESLLNNQDTGIKELIYIENIMNAMRKDLGMKKAKQGELLIFVVNDIKQQLNNMKRQ